MIAEVFRVYYRCCCLILVTFVHLQGNLDAVRILYMQTGDLGLKPNFFTFAILLQCHGRQQKLAVDAVKQVLKDVTRAVSICIVLCGFCICIRGYTGPAYFKHVCTLVSDISGRAHLRSAERHDMLVSRTRTELSRRSFLVAAPTVWNSLPAHLHSTLISRRQFRDGLKSHLFADAYF